MASPVLTGIKYPGAENFESNMFMFLPCKYFGPIASNRPEMSLPFHACRPVATVWERAIFRRLRDFVGLRPPTSIAVRLLRPEGPKAASAAVPGGRSDATTGRHPMKRSGIGMSPGGPTRSGEGEKG